MKTVLLQFFWMFLFTSAVFAFDHSHAPLNALLQQHVRWNAAGNASRVDYSALKQQHPALQGYLQQLSAVPYAEYQGWEKAQQLALLINAYNAFTLELILSKYPDLESIKDLGSFFSSPWKKKFFRLFAFE